MKNPRRTLAGRTNGMFHRDRVFFIEGGLEIDRVDIAEVKRQRVFYDDVTSVLMYKRTVVGWVVMGVLVALLGAVMMFPEEPVIRGIGFVMMMLGASSIVGGALLKSSDVVVRSSRTEARFGYVFRKAKARRHFERIVGEVRRAQIRKRHELGLREQSAPPPAPAAPGSEGSTEAAIPPDPLEPPFS